MNHLMYADDLVIMSPSVAGLYKLRHICESFGLSHDVLFNNKKSSIMSFRAGNLKDAHLPLYPGQPFMDEGHISTLTACRGPHDLSHSLV